MDQQKFDGIFDRLTPRRKEVLQLILAGHSDEAIADSLNIKPPTVRKYLERLYQAFGVSKRVELVTSFVKYKPQLLANSINTTQSLKSTLVDNEQQQITIGENQADWGEAPDTSIFYGRTNELKILKRWIVTDKCRLVLIQGIGGIGKTTLSVKLAQQLQSEFKCIIWRSLREAPHIEKILAELIEFLSEGQETDLKSTTADKITQLISCLRSSRCLLILDNVESILQKGVQTGQYRKGYEKYGDLLRQVGELSHQSCLVLTSREKPEEIIMQQGEKLLVRSLLLFGLSELPALEILKTKGFSGSEAKITELIQKVEGNPLVLKIISTYIKELFAGDISTFLSQGTTVFGSVDKLLEYQFNRLSELEKTVMYWLAINREAVSITQLREDILPELSAQPILLESLKSLNRRSLIQNTIGGITLQNVVMEYMTNRLIEKMSKEIKNGQIKLFHNYALIKATAKDFVRENQVRLILKPFAATLTNVERKLTELLETLRIQVPQTPGYAAGNILNLLCQLNYNLSDLDFSDLPVWQAYLQDRELYNVNFAHSDLTNSVFSRTFGTVLSVIFSPDGKLLAVGDAKGDIHLWEVANYQLILTCQGHSNKVWSVAFSPDSKTLVSGSEDKTVKIWDVRTGQCLQTLREHSDRIWSVTFSPQGDQFATASDDLSVRLWDAKSNKCLNLLKHTSGIRSIAFSPDGNILVSGSADKTLKTWDVHTGECLKTLRGHTDKIWSVVFSPILNKENLGRIIISCSDDLTVKLWNISTGKCLKTLKGHTNWVWSVTSSLQNHIIASASDDQTVKIWDIHTGECLKTLKGHTDRIWAVTFSPDGEAIASGGDDQTVRIWNVRTGECLKTLKGYTNWVWSVAFSPDGETIASGSDDQTVRIWNVRTGECLKTLKGHIRGVIRSVTFSPDGETIVSASADQTIRIWDVPTGQCLKVLQDHISCVCCVVFNPQDRIIASASDDQTVRIWDVSTGQCLKILSVNLNLTSSVVYSPSTPLAHDSKWGILASTCEDQTVKIWDLETGECLQTFQGHTSWVRSVAFSPDGAIIVSGSEDKTVKLWNVETGECLKTLHGHIDRVWSVTFSPVSIATPQGFGKMIASAGDDQTVRLWNVETGECLKIFYGHTNRVLSVRFSPQGNFIASGSVDETIRIWDVKTGNCLKVLRNPRLYDGMDITDVTGITEAQKSILRALGARQL